MSSNIIEDFHIHIGGHKSSVDEEFDTLKDLILHIMSNKPETRSDDTLLFVECCKHRGAKTLDEIPRTGVNSVSVHKIRQVIQNKKGLYKPDESVQKSRQKRNEDVRDYMRREA